MATKPVKPVLTGGAGLAGITLRWDRPKEADLQTLHIGSGTLATGVPTHFHTVWEIGSYPQYLTQHHVSSGNTDWFYSIRFTDKIGNVGNWSDSVKGGSVNSSGVWHYIYHVPSGSTTVALETVEGTQLEFNKQYTVTVEKGLPARTSGDWNPVETDYSFFFTSAYSPLFVSVQQIRLDIGPFISDIPDDTVNRMIYQHSYWANVHHPTTLTIPVPYYVYNYVKCATELDLLTSQYTRVALKSGSSIKLGDFTVDRDASEFTKMIGPIIDELRECKEKEEDSVINGGPVAIAATDAAKASTHTDGRRPIGITSTQWNREPRNQPAGRPRGPWAPRR